MPIAVGRPFAIARVSGGYKQRYQAIAPSFVFHITFMVIAWCRDLGGNEGSTLNLLPSRGRSYSELEYNLNIDASALYSPIKYKANTSDNDFVL